jgi:thioredoxin reductase (NADPH)
VWAKCVLIATGAQNRRIEAEGLEDFEGTGVYYAATAMEAHLSQGATVVVAGGGNSAGQAAMFLSESAEKVLLVICGKTLSKTMSSYLSRRIETQHNIEILFNTEIRRMSGKGRLEAVEFENTKTSERRVEKVRSVFSMIGAQPRTGCLGNQPPRCLRRRRRPVRFSQTVPGKSAAASERFASAYRRKT